MLLIVIILRGIERYSLHLLRKSCHASVSARLVHDLRRVGFEIVGRFGKKVVIAIDIATIRIVAIAAGGVVVIEHLVGWVTVEETFCLLWLLR
jgi:hypothetical protein